ncbi:MAG TPA: hypothetical protein VLX92_25890 [Kofleriaceae bacterium]|nr:hypothetical protein [Kofleriaceae bacterium]
MTRLVIAVLLVASAARADDVAPDPDRGWQWEGEVATRVGSILLDGVDVEHHAEGCGTAAIAPRHDRLALRLEADYCAARWPGTTAAQGAPAGAADGHVTQLHALARFYFARPRMRPDFVWLVGDFFVEAGAGDQMFSWDGGGRLSRPVGELGIGGNELIHWATGKAGLTVALRVEWAHRRGVLPPPSCAGPCDQPTRPSAYDHAILLTFGGVFGGNPRQAER